MNNTNKSYLTEPKLVTKNYFNNQLLYFTSSSLTQDDNYLIFLSERFGNPNIFVLDLKSGLERQLTNNKEGILKSYVYFDGTPYKGMSKASISIHQDSGKIYFIQGRKICVVDKLGEIKILTEYPKEQMTAFTHVSSDGKLLCVPTVDERALDGEIQLNGKPEYDIDDRVRTEKLSSYLRIYDTETGKEVNCEKVIGAWITHVQFSPNDNSKVLYNYEWPSNCGVRRIWLWDGKQHVALRTTSETRSKDDWTCHEMWERDGSAIIYHGSYTNGPAYVGRVKPDGSNLTEIEFPKSWVRYGHFTEGEPGMLVTDGYYDDKIKNSDEDLKAKDPSIDSGLKKSEISGEWISILKVDWEKQIINWVPLCRHGSSWESQDCHPHPIFNHAVDKIYFTSNKNGVRSIYYVEVPETK